MKTRIKIIVSILLVILVIGDVYGILRMTWHAPVSIRIGELTPRSAGISLRCSPPMIVYGETTSVSGQLRNATSSVGIPYQTLDLYYRSSYETLWIYVTSVFTAFDGSFSYYWSGSASLAPGFYVVNATFPSNDGFDVWSSRTDLRVVIVPPPPNLVTPGSSSSPGEKITTLTPTFRWDSVPGADEYGLYIRDMDSNILVFDSQVRGKTITGTSYTLLPGVLQWGRHYRWNMNSHNEAGWGEFCSPLYFQVLEAIGLLIRNACTDKASYVRSEVAEVQAQVFYELDPVENASVAFEVMDMNGTVWFSSSNKTDTQGIVKMEFTIPLTVFPGIQTIEAFAFKEDLGNTTGYTTFLIVDIPPEILDVSVIPQVVTEPTNVTIQANASDFEDSTNIEVFCLVSIPNGTVHKLAMLFDFSLFIAHYQVRDQDPTGVYTFRIVAKDRDGGTSEYQSSFSNEIPVDGGGVEGTVIDRWSQPISHSNVILSRVGAYLVYRNMTNDDGGYSFKNVLPGEYVLEASASEYTTNITSIDICVGITVTRNITLRKLPVVTGYVKSDEEAPIPSAHVTMSSVYGIVGTGDSDSEGLFRVVVSDAGAFSIEASAYGYAPNSTTITVSLEVVTSVNFTLAQNGIVSGVVKDQISGLPISDATVYLGKETYLGTQDITDQNGNFVFNNVLPEDYVVRATATGYLTNSSSPTVISGETCYVEMWLMPTGNITGVILDSDTGMAIEGAKVALIDDVGTVLIVCVADSNGSYAFEGVRPSSYTLEAYARGYNSTISPVEVKPYETSHVNFSLVPNMLFLELQAPSMIYSRGETVEFTIVVTNVQGQSIADNITDIQLVLLGPQSEKIDINVTRTGDVFTGNHTIKYNATIGIWTAIANTTDIHGNVGEEIRFIGVGEAFYVQFTSDKKNYIETENATFYVIVSMYSNLSRYLTGQDVNVTIQIADQYNNTRAGFPLATANDVFTGTYPLATFEVGNYTATATIDDGKGNRIMRDLSFKVAKDFSVNASTNKQFYNRTETVVISGSAEYANEEPIANTSVGITLEVKGYLRTYFTTTDSNGFFEYNFIPKGFDAGNYTGQISIVADGIERKANLTFAVHGLVLKPAQINFKISMNSANNISISVGNLGETVLTQLNVSVTLSVDGVNASIVDPPSASLLPGQWTQFTIRISAGESTVNTATFNITVSTAQGASENGVIVVNLYPATPVALVSPQIVDVSIPPGDYVVCEITIENIGYGAMNDVSLTAPSLFWVMVSANQLGDIKPSEGKMFSFLISPPSNTSIGIYSDEITILSDNHRSVSVYLILTVTSADNGHILLQVTDDLNSAVSDADVTLQYQEYYLAITHGTTNSTGYCFFVDLPVGRHSYLVTKEGHNSVGGDFVVQAAKTVTVSVLLPLKIIDVTFSVQPITVEDQYYTMLNLTFQTEIPPPYLLPVPLTLQFKADRAYVYDNGYSRTGEICIINTGFISVTDVYVYADISDSAQGYHISFLGLGDSIEIERLEAKEILRIPVTLSIDPGIMITELPSGFVGRVEIQGSFTYFDSGSDVPRKATANAEVCTFVFDAGDRWLDVDPSMICAINNDGVISFSFGSWPDRFPDITIINRARYENVHVYSPAVGGAIRVRVGFDASKPWDFLNWEGSLVYGEIDRSIDPGEAIPIVNADETFGWLSFDVNGGPLWSLLVQKLVGLSVLGDVYLPPSESAILQSERWDITTSWDDLLQNLIGLDARLGFEATVGGILFAYKWEHDPAPSACFIPIFIIDVNFPTIPIGPGGPYDDPPRPPWVIYETWPLIIKSVDSIPLPTYHETVKLSISQQATLERDAFLATLTMHNRLTQTQIENVNVTLKVTNQDGADATSSFFIANPRFENINAINGTGTIDPNATATVCWTIIPKPGAGGTSDIGLFYFVQASITYFVNGTQFNVNSTKETINVKPQPLLVLDYYIPSEVKADVPFKLAVKATNIGSGTARNLEVYSAQPEIRDNLSGLLISFCVTGSAIKGEPAGNSLKIDFGDISPGTSVIAYWVMTCSLDGEFLSFSASLTHINELGGTETSLIQSVNTHILMRDVMADDITFLFLIDANNDGTPDELIDPIFGDGTPVADVEYTVEYAAATLIIQTQKYEEDWIWIDLDDPFRNQMEVVQIERSDGKLLNEQNYWMVNGKIYIIDDPETEYTILFNVTYDQWETIFIESCGYPIVDFAVYNGNLYAAANNQLHIYDGSSWNAINAPIYAFSMETYGDKLILGGKGGLYSYDGTSFSLIFPVSAYIKPLGVYGNILYAGTALDRTPTLYYCEGSAENPANWHIDTAFATILNFSGPFGSIDSFAVYSDRMYLASGGTVYCFNGSDWSIVKTYSDVYAFLDIQVYNDKLYLATRDLGWRKPFYIDGTGFGGRVMEFDGNNWTTIFDHNYWIFSLETYNGKLYAGTANRILTYNGTDWEVSFELAEGAYYAISMITYNGRICAGMGNGYIFADPVSAR